MYARVLAALSLLACTADADTKRSPAQVRRYVVDSVAPNRIVMHPVKCATETTVATWSAHFRDPHAPTTDHACLAKITAGQTIEDSVQRFEDPKANPKILYVHRLGGCSATAVSLESTGKRCPSSK